MKKITIALATLLNSVMIFSQVGINTAEPNATYDITAKLSEGTSQIAEGLLIPRVDRQKARSMTGVRTSTLIYVNNVTTGSQSGSTVNINTPGYYYFNGTQWLKWNATTTQDINIYNSNGTLSANRMIKLDDKKIAFTGTANNMLAVDATTFTISGSKHNIGIGTTNPQKRLDLGTTLGTISNSVAKKLAIYNNSEGNNFYGLGINTNLLQFHAASAANDQPKMVLNSNKYLGIGTTTPAAFLHVAGNLKLSDGTEGVDKILTSDSDGVATWQEIPVSYLLRNIYETDGSLTANRTLAQNANTLAFEAITPNGFSVDNSTFSVNAQEHRVGIGTTAPQNLLDLGDDIPTDPANPVAKKIAVSNNATGTAFYGIGASERKLNFHAAATTTAEPQMTMDKDGRLSIGTVFPKADALLELSSTNKAFLPPRMTQQQRDMISPREPGLMIYNTSNNCLQYWTSTLWQNECDPGAIVTLNCEGARHNGSLVVNVNASGVNSVVSYTGGSGEYHSGQTVASINFPELTATLDPGMFAIGDGTITYKITGSPLSAGIAEFPINIGGQQCIIKRVIVSVGAIGGTLNCSTAINVGALRADVSVTGTSVYSDISYTGGNGGPHNGQIISSTGVQGLTATLTAGNFSNGSGTLRYTITGTPDRSGIATFNINIGGRTCILQRQVAEAVVPVPGACGAIIPYGTIGGYFYMNIKGKQVPIWRSGASNTYTGSTLCGVSAPSSTNAFYEYLSAGGFSARTDSRSKFRFTNIKIKAIGLNRGEGFTIQARNQNNSSALVQGLTFTVSNGCSSSVSTSRNGNIFTVKGTGSGTYNVEITLSGAWFDDFIVLNTITSLHNQGITYEACIGDIAQYN